jgi:hypothetical protein
MTKMMWHAAIHRKNKITEEYNSLQSVAIVGFGAIDLHTLLFVSLTLVV